MSDNPFKELQDLHRVFEFKNKTTNVQPVELLGDSTKVLPRGTLKLQSSKFSQLPSTSVFEFIKPSLDDLRAVGLLSTGTPKSTSNDSSTSEPETAGEEE